MPDSSDSQEQELMGSRAMCAHMDNLRVQLLQHNAIHHKGNDLDDDQNRKHSNRKIAELSDGTLGSRRVQQLVQLSELLGSCKLLMAFVIHLQEQHDYNTVYTACQATNAQPSIICKLCINIFCRYDSYFTEA